MNASKKHANITTAVQPSPPLPSVSLQSSANPATGKQIRAEGSSGQFPATVHSEKTKKRSKANGENNTVLTLELHPVSLDVASTTHLKSPQKRQPGGENPTVHPLLKIAFSTPQKDLQSENVTDLLRARKGKQSSNDMGEDNKITLKSQVHQINEKSLVNATFYPKIGTTVENKKQTIVNLSLPGTTDTAKEHGSLMSDKPSSETTGRVTERKPDLSE